MQGAHRTTHPDLEALRLRIAAIETRPVLAGTALSQAGTAQGVLPLPAGVLTEVFADEQRDSGAALGFSLGLARGLLSGRRSALIVLQLADEAQEMGVAYGSGLSHFGLDPERVVLARPKTIIELLWAMEEAIACRSVAAVIADIGSRHKALDFTASRRLSLRSASAGASVFLVRYLREREASAAKYRWRVTPAPSGAVPFDARAPGPPRWQARLEKGRLRPEQAAAADGENYLLDWTDDGFVLAHPPQPIQGFGRNAADGRPALFRPQPAELGDGLSQAS